MKILALDLATKMGWAYASDPMRPTCDTEVLKKGDEPAEVAFRRLALWLDTSLRTDTAMGRVDLLAIEKPANIGGLIDWDASAVSPRPKPKFRSNPETIYLLNGLVAIAEGIAGLAGVKTAQGHVMTVRKHFLGTARPEFPKRATILRCRQLGLMTQIDRDDNKADALALLFWAHCHFNHVPITPAGGLFDERKGRSAARL
jgi:hypothetical protein